MLTCPGTMSVELRRPAGADAVNSGMCLGFFTQVMGLDVNSRELSFLFVQQKKEAGCVT